MYLGDCPSLYGYDDEMGLGKFKLKKAVKSVTKAAGQVAKVAVAPAAIAAASSLQAVGLRHAASQVVQKTALNKKIAAAEQKFTKAAGTAIDVAAAATAATIAAPYVASAATTAAHAAGAAGAKGLLLAKTLGKKGNILGSLTGLLKKKSSSGGAADAGGSDTISTITQDVKEAEAAAGPLVKRVKKVRSQISALTPSGGAEAPAPDSGGDAGGGGGPASGPAPSYSMTPSGGDSGGSPASPDAQPPDAAAAEPKKVPTWLLFAPALFLL